MKPRGWTCLLIGIVLGTLVLTGATGCGGGGDGGTGTGVSGYVRNIDTNQGVESMTVVVGTSADATDSNGFFQVTGLPPGPTSVVVIPTALFVPVPGAPPVAVTVVSGQVTPLASPFWVIDLAKLPPTP